MIVDRLTMAQQLRNISMSGGWQKLTSWDVLPLWVQDEWLEAADKVRSAMREENDI